MQSEPRNYTSLPENMDPKDCLIIPSSILHERIDIKNNSKG